MQKAKPSWRELVNKDRPFVLPGAYDALSAKLIEQTGFEGMVVGGFPLVGSRYGIPDIGLVGLGEMAAGMRDIINATGIPVLVDGDHGYGDIKNVAHTVHTYEKMGAAALLLEDQVMPKRCGHAQGKNVIEADDMSKKIRAAVKARESKDFFIIARTDARGVHGLDDALRRSEKNLNAGADGIFIEAPQSVKELELIAKTFDVPQMCNMLIGGKTPILSNRELHEIGFRMIVHGTTVIKRVARSLRNVLQELHQDSLNLELSKYVPLEDFMAMTGMKEWEAFEQSVNSGESAWKHPD